MGSAVPILFSLMCLLLLKCASSWDDTSNLDPSKNETPSKIAAGTTVKTPIENSASIPVRSTSTSVTVVLSAPEDFFVTLLKNKTVYLSWKEIVHQNVSYQLYMAYGNQSSQSKYIHLESTLSHSETITIRRLMNLVEGDVHQYTYLKFKIRVSLGANRFGNFSDAKVVSLHDYTMTRSDSTLIAIQNQQIVWRYILPIVCVVLGAVLTLIGIYTYKQVLYKRRYRQYMRTHYETDSEAVSVSNENYDFEQNDLHLSFGAGVDHRDDENLVIA